MEWGLFFQIAALMFWGAVLAATVKGMKGNK
jgi:hypothetical protein